MNQISKYWEEFFHFNRTDVDWWLRKRNSFEERESSIVRIQGDGHIFRELCYDNKTIYQYLLHVSFLIKSEDRLYIEEQVIPYECQLVNGEITGHRQIEKQAMVNKEKQLLLADDRLSKRNKGERFTYDPLAAVKYAERWWNSYNPEFRTFSDDCTNYISQCLLAGRAPMHGAPNRSKGWWYQKNNWSFSWAVAHSLRWYLSGATYGLQGKEVSSAKELYPGDIICYDFEGDNKWDHNTIVVAKDGDGMPLVNAHTNNSRHRYWTYEDSAAWTPNIQYKFFQIGKSIS